MAELHAVEIPKNEKELTYYELNNKINIPVNGQIQLQYDKEAVKAYFRQHINQSSLFSYTLEEKIDTLILGNYISKEMIDKYDMKFIKKLFKSIYAKKFRFDSFMGAYKFYRQYAMKNDTGDRYLERFEDRVAFNALYLADGDEELAMRIGEEMISRRYQPATPTYLNAGKARAGEAVSCFTGDTLVTVKNNGRKRIDSIEVGDYVLTHTGTYEKVEGVNVREYNDKKVEIIVDGITDVVYSTGDGQIVSYNGEDNVEAIQINSVNTTLEHPFLVYREDSNFGDDEIALHGDGDTPNIKWVKAESIKDGDYIVNKTEKVSEEDDLIVYGYSLKRVKSSRLYDTDTIKVYNLEVENNHTYVANGILVHNCFLIGDVTDSMDSITRSWVSSAHLSKLGGGVGIDLSNVREEGAPIKGIHGAASGVVPIMKIYEDIFSYANQLGQRQGAGAVYLNIFHMDVIQFLATRKENADEKVRVKTLSLGLTVPDKYYELIKKDEWMYLFSPYDAERVYGKPFSFIDITKEYDNMVNNPDIRKSKVKARELETEISKLQQESGYPYILNIDTVNKANPVHGKVVMSNLCTEIMQVHKTSEMNKDQTYKTIGNDVSCNLGSINIPNMMKSKDFGRSIDTMIRALTTVSDKTDIQEVPTIRKANTSYHSVGLGAMGLATYFAINKMEYGSPESIEFVDVFFRMVNYYSLVASNNIAKERKATFHEFEKSKYYTGEYFDRYINEGNVIFKNPKIERMFKGFHVPTVEDWKELARKVKTHGLYHSYRLAVAPNGSISYVNETSASLHPIINLIEERQEKKIGKVYYPVPHLNNNTIKYYKSAYDTDMRKVIDVYAAAQKHIDQGMSLTLFMRSDIPEGLYEWKDGRTTKMTTRDLNILRNYAWKKGIKSLYYVRTFTDDAEEIGASQCESCSI